MNILEYCDPEPASVLVSSNVAEAIQLMTRRGTGATAVVDQDGVVAGIFTERDVMTRVALSGRDPHQIPITDVMTTPVLMATRNTTIVEATADMVTHQRRHLPVIEDDGRLIGMLSIRHVLELKVDELTAQL